MWDFEDAVLFLSAEYIVRNKNDVRVYLLHSRT